MNARQSTVVLALLTSCTEAAAPEPAVGGTGSMVASTESGDASESESSPGSEADSSGSLEGSTGHQDGVELFAGLCAPCHGADGEGTALAYELQHPDREHATWVVRNGRPGVEFDNSVMIAFSPSVVSDEQLEQIWDWLDTFPQPTTGEQLYLDYCRNCHGADQSGGACHKDISDKEPQDILEKVRQGEGLGTIGERERYMSRRDAGVLSNAEVQAIAEYIAEE